MCLDAPLLLNRIPAVAVSFLLFSVACRPGAHDGDAGEIDELVLESGEVIGIIEFSHDVDGETLELEYKTKHRILEDHQALQYEAEDIWAEFLQREADARGVTLVHLSPRDDTPPVFGMSFRISRADSGEWRKEGGFAYPVKRQ